MPGERRCAADARTRIAKRLIIREFDRFPPRRAARAHAPSPASILLNKPFGVLCQFTGRRRRPTLADFVAAPDVYPAGRLDADSEGLVVLTADGALQARIADPRHKLRKTYWVQVEGEPAAGAARGARARRRRCADGPTRPAQARVDGRAAVAVAARSADPRAPARSPPRGSRSRIARGPQPAGAADDRGGRPADAAPHPLVGRPLDARGPRARASRAVAAVL